MSLVSITIRGTVITSRYGVLSSGDVLRTDAEYARHLVEDCKAADYAAAKHSQEDEPKAAPQAAAQGRPRKSKG